jgi:hypothetical protein
MDSLLFLKNPIKNNNLVLLEIEKEKKHLEE